MRQGWHPHRPVPLLPASDSGRTEEEEEGIDVIGVRVSQEQMVQVRELAVSNVPDVEIQKRVGLCRQVVHRIRLNAGIRRRSTYVDREETGRILNLLRAGESTQEVALATGRPNGTVRSVAWRAGVKHPGRIAGCMRIRKPRTSLEIHPETRKRLLDAENRLGTRNADATVKKLLDMGGF